MRVKYKTVSYKRIKNLGNYENEALEMSVELLENESPELAFELIKRKIEMALGLVPNTKERLPDDSF